MKEVKLQNRYVSDFQRLFLLIFIALMGCSSSGTEVSLGWKLPVVPIRVSVDHRLKVTVAASYGVLTTPVGTFDITISQSVSRIQRNHLYPTLIVVIDGTATVFKLDPDINFEVTFDETSVYKIRELKKENNNIVLIIETVTQPSTLRSPTLPPQTRAASTPTPRFQTSATITCSGAATTRLNVGMRARVTHTDGSPNSIRNAPTSRTVLGTAPEGTGMKIVGGPRCDNRLIWWHVETDNNLTGWTAEGRPGDYWLEPIR